MNGFGFIEYDDAMDARDVVPGEFFCSKYGVKYSPRGAYAPALIQLEVGLGFAVVQSGAFAGHTHLQATTIHTVGSTS